MARNYTTSTTTLWRPESKFTRLTGRQQAVYQMLKGQEQITAAGVLPLTLKRWAQTASDYTTDTLSEDLAVLVAEGHLVVDDDTEEVLVVKFVRWDAGYGNSKRQGVICDAAQRIMSAALRRSLADELDSLNALPDLAVELRGCPIPNTEIGHTDTSDGVSQEVAIGLTGNFDLHRVVVTEVSTDRNPQPTNLSTPDGADQPPTKTASFDEFWAAYPKRVAKGAARKAWDKAVKKTDPETIIKAAQRYADDRSREEKFTAHPATWLNQERWGDESITDSSSSSTPFWEA